MMFRQNNRSRRCGDGSEADDGRLGGGAKKKLPDGLERGLGTVSRVGWRERWRERRRRGYGMLAYQLWRRISERLRLGRVIDFRVHDIIAVVPWRLRIPARLPRQMTVRELHPADAGELRRLRVPIGVGYAERLEAGHSGLGAFLDGRLVAFVWLQRGPMLMRSAFACVWQIGPGMAWVYDLYSDPAVLGAVPFLYARLRQAAPGNGCQILVGQTDLDNQRSRLAHERLGYEAGARLWSLGVGRFRVHLTRSRKGKRWRWHGREGVIPLVDIFARTELAPPPLAPIEAESGGVRLRCSCGRAVAVGSAGSIACRCGRALGAWRNGLAVIGSPTPYWGEIGQQAMQDLLARAGAVGWQAAVDGLLPAKLRDYVEAPHRADFDDLIPLLRGARVLDIGAGWGGIALPLARRYRVVALEGVEERARAIQLRAQQAGLESNLTVLNGSVSATTFAGGQFDLIVANGILEWTALFDTSASPRMVQLGFLQRLRELLAPGGMLYLAIENRFGWSELRGTVDHSGLPYTSLLPRPLARWVCAHNRQYRAQFNVGYRTYTYSHRGYERLFRQAGLRMRETWISPMGYNRPSKLVPVNGPAIRFAQQRARVPAEGWRRRVRAAAQWWMAQEAIWRWIGSDYAFLLEAAEATGIRRSRAQAAAEMTRHA